jgi:hypothetical protein
VGIATKKAVLSSLLLLLLASCANGEGAVLIDAQYNLTCPLDTAIDCGSLAPETCLGPAGQRAIVGVHGQASCTGEPIIAICEAVPRSDGSRTVALEANIGGRFAFELRGATIDDGTMVQQTACNVTILEDEVPYDVGACGEEPPSMAQPCRLSNINVAGGEVAFDFECVSLLSSVTGTSGFDVGAVGGGPATMRFLNCNGF